MEYQASQSSFGKFHICVQEAERSLRFYRNCNGQNKERELELIQEFDKFKAIAEQNEIAPKLEISDFCKPYLF